MAPVRPYGGMTVLMLKWTVAEKLLMLEDEVSWRIKSLLNLCALLFVVSCGSPKNSTNSIPQAENPEEKKVPQTITVPTPPTTDSRLPDLSTASAINLTDYTNFTGLIDLAGNMFPPLVGDPKIILHVPANRSQYLYNGDVLVAFEDKQGFWGAQLSLFAKSTINAYDPSTKTLTNSQFTTGFLIGNTLDMTFGDSELIVRVTGTVNTAGDLNGSIYYRIPQAGETACHQIQVNCVANPNYIQQYYPYYPYINPNYKDDASNPMGLCSYASDTASKCISYMNTTNANVKKLGSFVKKDYRATWATLSEGQ